MKKQHIHRVYLGVCLMLALVIGANAQTITSVTPDSAAQGTAELLVTLLIHADSTQMPPPDAPVDQATIGTIQGTSITHLDTVVTGVFSIPFDEEIGAKDVTVIFTPPPDQGEPLVFLLPGGFTVTEMPDTAPVITTQPESKSVRIGRSTSLSVGAYGSSPIHYQWQKNQIDIAGDTSSTFTISSFAETDVASYRCVISNFFGTVTSENAELTVNTTSYAGTYPIVDTNQNICYGNSGQIDCPAQGEAFYGQDAQYAGTPPSYTDNSDGTITDNITGLIWSQEQSSETMPWNRASDFCESLTTGGYTDWRLPTVKELWSIRDFSAGWPWIDTTYFHLTGDGTEMREHHSWTSNLYLVESEYQNEQVQGDPAWIVNDWTGHIKAMSGARFVRAVRGTVTYGINDFVDNSDGTITDNATGLMWSQDDNGGHVYWKEALAYAESATLAGYDDWRLPNIKELQSIADYSVKEIPAIDKSMFILTNVTNLVDGTIEQSNYPFYWSSTSNPVQSDDGDGGGTIHAWFFSSGYNVDMAGYDLHGAGSICFGSKTEENSGMEDSVPFMVRLVRDAHESTDVGNNNGFIPQKFELGQNYPNPFNPTTTIGFTLPATAKVTLKIYNTVGQLLTTLVDGQLARGYHKYQWQASNLPSGIYIYKLSTNSQSVVKRMILMK